MPLGFPHPPAHDLQPISLLHPTTQEILATLSVLAPVLQDQLQGAGYRKAQTFQNPQLKVSRDLSEIPSNERTTGRREAPKGMHSEPLTSGSKS